MVLNGGVDATHVDGGFSFGSQVERLQPKSEAVPRCCLSDRWGKIQIRENQENAKSRGPMHPMERPHVVRHHQPKQHINPIDGELLISATCTGKRENAAAIITIVASRISLLCASAFLRRAKAAPASTAKLTCSRNGIVSKLRTSRIMRIPVQLVSRNQEPNSNHHHGKGKARNPKRHVPLDLLC